MINRSQLNDCMYTLLLLLVSFYAVIAQEKSLMTPEVYKIWNKLKLQDTDDSLKYVAYLLEKETGNKILMIYDRLNDSYRQIERGSQAVVDPSGIFIAYRISHDYEALKDLKRKKTAKDKMPKDSLVVTNLLTNETLRFPGIDQFMRPKKYGSYLAALLNTESKESSDGNKDNKKEKADGNKDNKYGKLLIFNFMTSSIDSFDNVSEFVFCDEWPRFAYVTKSGDSITQHTLVYINLGSGEKIEVFSSDKKIQNIVLDKSGDQLAFYVVNDNDGKSNQCEIHHFSLLNRQLSKIEESEKFSLPPNYEFSKNAPLYFSETGQRLFWGISPKIMQRDSTILDEDMPELEVWHYDDGNLYTVDKVNLDKDKKKSYRYYLDLVDQTIRKIEDIRMDASVVSIKNDGRYALLTDQSSYRKLMTWEGNIPVDIHLLDLNTGEKIRLAEKHSSAASFSPGGKYAQWYNRYDSIWYAFDIRMRKTIKLNGGIKVPFYDELNDVPDQPVSYGTAGWTFDDRQIWLYDRYDIWHIDPLNLPLARRLTDGRERKIRYRYLKTDPEADFIDINASHYIHAFDENDKSEYYLKWNFSTGSKDTLFGGAYKLQSRLTKARKEDLFLFTFENFETFPDLHLADGSFREIKRISQANPQQQEYGWGSSRLIEWESYDGTPRRGMLFLPPGFDPESQYPLIVNFYERSSDNLHQHRAPEAHRSTINYTYYTNKGYVVFNPDIHYKIGYPGQSAFEDVMSGVDALLREGFIDSTRMGLQGHSWGGYQVAYIINQTHRFKCAESGAPVVNMVSAYGGIRWETGLSRMFQYEKGQSRLGENLWNDPVKYFENSPLYSMYKLNTPVLIMHNDADGHVPWYQGIEYYMALRRLEKPCWLLNYNNEPHWPLKWPNRLDFNIRMEQFFDHYLMGKPMPLWMKEGIKPSEKTVLTKYELED